MLKRGPKGQLSRALTGVPILLTSELGSASAPRVA